MCTDSSLSRDWIIAVVVCSMLGIAFSSEAPDGSAKDKTRAPVTLAEVVRLAETHNPTLREAAAQIEAARGRAQQAGLYPNPTLTGGTGQLGGQASEYQVTFSQELITRGKLRRDQQAACHLVEQAELAHAEQRFAVLTIVRQRFFQVLAAQHRLHELGRLVDLARRSQQSVERLLKSGEGTRSDLLLLEIELSRATSDVDSARAQLDAARRQLAAALGRHDLLIGEVEAALDAPLPAFPSPALLDSAVEYHTSARSAAVNIDRARVVLGRAEVERTPNLTVIAGYQYNVDSPNHVAIAQLGVPIPIWDRNTGAIRAARADLTGAVEGLDRVRNRLADQIAEANGRFLAARSRVQKFQHEILPKANEAQQLAQKGYDEGQFDFLRLLQAQRSLSQATLDYIAAQEQRWLAACELAGLLQLDSFP
jgi:cobalt-zinc-cadmium efflux system outer membrane protein